MTTETPFMPIPEVARELERSEVRVYQLIAAGVIPSVRIGGRIRVPRAAFAAWVAQANRRALAGAGIDGGTDEAA